MTNCWFVLFCVKIQKLGPKRDLIFSKKNMPDGQTDGWMQHNMDRTRQPI